ncbi:MAG: hypothetical protein QW797_09850 [Thermoproteota archaeon]
MSVSNGLKAACAALAETLAFTGAAGWLYGVWVSHYHPEWLTLPLTHLTLWLRTDTFGTFSFAAMVVGFFTWRLTKNGWRR